MELKQFRYFVAVARHGSMGKAALELGVVTSTLSQQLGRLEGELSTRLLRRTQSGVVPTDAGMAFLRQAQLALRHADNAIAAAQRARLSGHVTVGLPSSTAGILGLPFMQAMQARYPDVQVHLVESLSGYLSTMLIARQIDLAILFNVEPAQRWNVRHLLDERLFVIGDDVQLGIPRGDTVSLSECGKLPLVLPSATHGLRALLASCFHHAGISPRIVAEVDGLQLLMDAVRGGLGATIQPGSALARAPTTGLVSVLISDIQASRTNVLVSLSDNELSPAGLGARVVLTDVVRTLAEEGRWPGATLARSMTDYR